MKSATAFFLAHAVHGGRSREQRIKALEHADYFHPEVGQFQMIRELLCSRFNHSPSFNCSMHTNKYSSSTGWHVYIDTVAAIKSYLFICIEQPYNPVQWYHFDKITLTCRSRIVLPAKVASLHYTYFSLRHINTSNVNLPQNTLHAVLNNVCMYLLQLQYLSCSSIVLILTSALASSTMN